MLHPRFPSAAAALLALALGGCATHASSAGDAQLAAFPQLQGLEGRPRPCRPAEAPRVLPAANAVVDSAALVAGLASLGEGTAVYSLLFAADGSVLRAAPIGRSGGLAADGALAESVRRQGAAGERWGVQLRVTGGARPSLRVGRQEHCPVVATLMHPATAAGALESSLDRAAWTAGATGVAPGDGPFLAPTGLTPTAADYVATPIRKARFTLTAQGEVVNPSGDAAKLRRLSLHRLEPALIDRIPVETTIEW
jgi:hypothetical protein